MGPWPHVVAARLESIQAPTSADPHRATTLEAGLPGGTHTKIRTFSGPPPSQKPHAPASPPVSVVRLLCHQQTKNLLVPHSAKKPGFFGYFLCLLRILEKVLFARFSALLSDSPE